MCFSKGCHGDASVFVIVMGWELRWEAHHSPTLVGDTCFNDYPLKERKTEDNEKTEGDETALSAADVHLRGITPGRDDCSGWTVELKLAANLVVEVLVWLEYCGVFRLFQLRGVSLEPVYMVEIKL